MPATHVSMAVSASMAGHRTWTAEECWDAFESCWLAISPANEIPTLARGQVTPEIINLMAIMEREHAADDCIVLMRAMVSKAASTSGAPAPAGCLASGTRAAGATGDALEVPADGPSSCMAEGSDGPSRLLEACPSGSRLTATRAALARTGTLPTMEAMVPVRSLPTP